MIKKLWPLVLLLSVFVLTTCGPAPTRIEDLDTTEITLPGGKTIVAETMRRDDDIMRGMMFRDALAKDRGMLFVHPQEGKYAYWMYHCHIPLDMLWMDHDRRIVEISADTPPCTSEDSKDCPGYGGHETAKYVLELNAGAAAAYGLHAGDTLSF